MSAAPETVTFLFTDMEGSTRLAQELGDRDFRELLARETALVVGAAEAEGGRTFGSEGDAHFLAFGSAASAIRAAVQAQQALAGEPWPGGRAVRVRMGIHTGEALRVGDDYAGLTLHRVARIAAAAHGAQILVSSATAALAAGGLGDLALRDLGEHRLKDLPEPERIHQVVGDGLPATFPALRTLERAPNNLPTALTSFVGRAELAVAHELLRRTRLLTLTGPGGTGKTRLSIALAAEAMADYPDGVWFVPLATLADATLVGPAIATAIGLVADPLHDPVDRVVDHLRTRRALLVLDNFEQVLDAAPIVAQLLREAPDLRAVVSSRAPLRISGEQEFAVPPLSLPEPGAERDPERLLASEAVRLFLERAMAVRADLTLTPENGPAIAEIVRRLDGLPLAIELAAARVRILSPVAIQTRLADRLGLLTGGARDLPARQQTLRGAIEWSHDLLDDGPRHLFARLGVFVGSGRIDTAEGVCGPAAEVGVDVFEGTASLAEQSLVRVVEDAHADARFQMLETIREYASERLVALGEATDLRDRHARAFLELAQELAAGLSGPDRRVWLDRFEDDHDNFRAALAWRIAGGDAAGAAALLAAIWRFWQARGHVAEGRLRAADVIAMPGWSSAPLAARIQTLDVAGGLAYWAGDMVATNQLYTDQVRLARELADPTALANALYNLAFTPEPFWDAAGWSAAVRDKALPLLHEALALWRSVGDASGVARGLWMLGELGLFARDLPAAIASYTEAIAAFEQLGDDFGAAWAYFTRGVAHVDGDRAAARMDLRTAYRRFVAAGDHAGITFVAHVLASLTLGDGEPVLGHRLGGIAKRLLDESGAQLGAIAPAGWETIDPVAIDDPADRMAYDDGYALGREAALALIAQVLDVDAEVAR
jgi:predicted ATPase/class 3 adenylate cyclase